MVCGLKNQVCKIPVCSNPISKNEDEEEGGDR